MAMLPVMYNQKIGAKDNRGIPLLSAQRSPLVEVGAGLKNARAAPAFARRLLVPNPSLLYDSLERHCLLASLLVINRGATAAL